MEYLIGRDAGKAGTPDGILEDDQCNTYDQALHGVTTFMSGYYLAALRAGEEWARRMGDAQTADRFHAIFLKGQENLVKRCWNGEYFQQDLPDYHKRTQQVDQGRRWARSAPAAWPTNSSASGGPTNSAWATSCPRTKSKPPSARSSSTTGSPT